MSFLLLLTLLVPDFTLFLKPPTSIQSIKRQTDLEESLKERPSSWIKDTEASEALLNNLTA